MSPNWYCRGNIMWSLCHHCRDLWLQTPHKTLFTHTHTHFKIAFLQQYSSLFLFSVKEKHVGDGLRENNREKETNLKGIDFLILINTFPLLRAFWWPYIYFSDVVQEWHLQYFTCFKYFWSYIGKDTLSFFIFHSFFIAKAQIIQLNCCNNRKQLQKKEFMGRWCEVEHDENYNLFLCDLEHQRGGIPPQSSPSLWAEITRSGLWFVWTSPHRQNISAHGAMTRYKDSPINKLLFSLVYVARLACNWAEWVKAFHKPKRWGSKRRL